jgi:hypothetical protein
MSPKGIRGLLDRIGGIGNPCDLDLLIFFRRHPLAVLTSERLALYVGYELSQVATSLETLIAAGLLTRVQRPTSSARMYVLTDGGPDGGWLETLLQLTSTRDGRLAALAALSARRPATESSSPGGSGPSAVRAPRRSQARDARELRHA